MNEKKFKNMKKELETVRSFSLQVLKTVGLFKTLKKAIDQDIETKYIDQLNYKIKKS